MAPVLSPSTHHDGGQPEPLLSLSPPPSLSLSSSSVVLLSPLSPLPLPPPALLLCPPEGEGVAVIAAGAGVSGLYVERGGGVPGAGSAAKLVSVPGCEPCHLRAKCVCCRCVILWRRFFLYLLFLS